MRADKLTQGLPVKYYDEKKGFWVRCRVVSFSKTHVVIGTDKGHFRREVKIEEVQS